jgi:hypothetical protein
MAKLTRARALAIFKKLKAKDAAFLAGKEAEGKPALARHLFLRAAARCVWDEDDTAWPERYDPAHPIAAAVKRALAKGIDPSDLTDIVRDAQWDVLFNIMCLLEDSAHGIEDFQEAIDENVEWRLAEVDENERPTGRILGGLHADIGAFDPTGRGGEPRRCKPDRKLVAKHAR